MKEIKSIIYETVDGTLFTDKKEAEKHEKRLLGRRFFRVYAHPDLTEGRHNWKVEQISEFNLTDIKNSSDNYLGSVDENGFHSFIK